MKSLATLLFMAFTTVAAYGAPVITETEKGYVVDYVGTPKVSKPVDPVVLSASSKRIIFLSAEIYRLSTEGMEVLQPAGTEPMNGQSATKAQIDVKLKLMEQHLAEMKKLIEANKVDLEEMQKLPKRESDRQSVVTGGLPPEQYTDMLFQRDEALVRLTRQLTEARSQRREEPPKPLPVDEIKVTGIYALDTNRSADYVTYSFKADVDNKGERGEVFIKLIGKNRDGHEMKTVMLSGWLDKGESRTLTTTATVTLQQAMDIRSWDVGEISKYDKPRNVSHGE